MYSVKNTLSCVCSSNEVSKYQTVVIVKINYILYGIPRFLTNWSNTVQFRVTYKCLWQAMYIRVVSVFIQVCVWILTPHPIFCIRCTLISSDWSLCVKLRVDSRIVVKLYSIFQCYSPSFIIYFTLWLIYHLRNWEPWQRMKKLCHDWYLLCTALCFYILIHDSG